MILILKVTWHPTLARARDSPVLLLVPEEFEVFELFEVPEELELPVLVDDPDFFEFPSDEELPVF